MTEDDFMTVAWASFVQWAITDRGCRAQFKEETGIALDAKARSGLEVLIDDATGRRESETMAFLKWATITLWGDDGGVPPELLAKWRAEDAAPPKP